jgi:hypothetical protein
MDLGLGCASNNKKTQQTQKTKQTQLTAKTQHKK